MSADGPHLVQLYSADDVADEQTPVIEDGTGCGACLHPRVKLNPHVRRAYCRECKVEVPAFDVLTQMAREFANYRHRRLDARRRAETAEANLKDLLRMEANARARLRRLKAKLPPPEPGAHPYDPDEPPF